MIKLIVITESLKKYYEHTFPHIKNKIQVIDGNEYGTILSPFRSIQQEFEQSSSYTEDLNSLENSQH